MNDLPWSAKLSTKNPDLFLFNPLASYTSNWEVSSSSNVRAVVSSSSDTRCSNLPISAIVNRLYVNIRLLISLSSIIYGFKVTSNKSKDFSGDLGSSAWIDGAPSTTSTPPSRLITTLTALPR